MGVLVPFTVVLLCRFQRRDTHWTYTVLVSLTWFLGFFGTGFLPVDVSYSAHLPGGTAAMRTLWQVVYWVTFALSWVVLPVAMEFHSAGEFEFGRRFRHALRNNLRLYMFMGAAALVALVWLWFAGADLLRLFTKLGAAANAYGLILVMLLAGYGAVDIPTLLWRNGSRSRQLELLEYRAGALDEQLFDARCELQRAHQAAMDTGAALATAPRDTWASGEAKDGTMHGHDRTHRCVATLTALADRAQASMAAAEAAEGGAPDAPRGRRNAAASGTGSGRSSGVGLLQKSQLARTHAELKAALATYDKAAFKWERAVKEFVRLRARKTILKQWMRRGGCLQVAVEVCSCSPCRGSAGGSLGGSSSAASLASRRRPARVGRGAAATIDLGDADTDEDGDLVDPAFVRGVCCGVGRTDLCRCCRQRGCLVCMELFVSLSNRILSVLCWCLTAVLLWCEFSPLVAKLAKGAQLSLIGFTISSAPSGWWRVLVSAAWLSYLDLCMYHGLFSLRPFARMELTAHRSTDAYGLIFHAIYLCRLQFSASLNFLLISQFEGNTPDAQGDDGSVPLVVGAGEPPSTHCQYSPCTAFDSTVGRSIGLGPAEAWLTLLMLGTAALVLFGWWGQLLRLVGLDHADLPRGSEDDISRIQEGRTYLEHAVRRMQLYGSGAQQGRRRGGGDGAGGHARGGSRRRAADWRGESSDRASLIPGDRSGGQDIEIPSISRGGGSGGALAAAAEQEQAPSSWLGMFGSTTRSPAPAPASAAGSGRRALPDLRDFLANAPDVRK